MTTRTHLNAITNGNKIDLPLIGQLFLKFGSSSAEISENGGPVLIYEQDGVVTVKVETDAKGLLFNDHEVKKGGIYFFELGDILKYKSTEISLSAVEIIQSKFSNIEDDFDFDKDNEETKIIVQENLDMTTLLNNPSKASLLAQTENREVKKSSDITKENTLNFEVPKTQDPKPKIERPKFTRPEPKTEFTKTSIDIQQLLKSADSKDIEASDKSQKKPSMLEKSREKKSGEKKSGKLDLSKLKKVNSNNSLDSLRICGPFTRFFAFLTSITIAFFIYQFLNHEILTNYSAVLTDLIFNNVSQLENYVDYKVQLTSLLKFFAIYSAIEFTSAVFLSTSLPLFLIGVTTTGNILTKRIKAVVRFPLDIISTFIFIFEFPILFGKRTLKETLTLSKIGYRSIIFKIFALPLLISLLLLSVFYTFLLDFRGEVHPKEIFSSALFRESSATNYSNLYISKNIENNFEIIGWQKPSINYLLVKKSDASTIRLREYNSLSFRVFDKLQKSIPLFSIFYANLDKYLNNEAHEIEAVRKDVVRLIRSGEFQLLQNHENIEALNILSSNQMTKFLRDQHMNFDKIITTGDFTRIYEFKNEMSLIFIGRDAIKLIAIDSRDQSLSAYLQQIALNTKTTNPSSLDQIQNSPEQIQEFISSFTQKINSIKELISTKNSGANQEFNKFIGELEKFQAYENPQFKALVDSRL